jgi:hypothetical protein
MRYTKIQKDFFVAQLAAWELFCAAGEAEDRLYRGLVGYSCYFFLADAGLLRRSPTDELIIA